MTLNTKDLYLGSVGVGTTAPYQTVPATALVDEFGNIISEFTISAGIVTVTNIISEIEIKNDSGNPIPISDAGGSITIDNSTITTINTKLPSLSNSRIPVQVDVLARTPTTTSVASTTVSTEIVSLNANRKGILINNQSASNLYLSFSTPATSSNSFIEMVAGSVLALDQQMIVTNAVYGIWKSANGRAQVTQFE